MKWKCVKIFGNDTDKLFDNQLYVTMEQVRDRESDLGWTDPNKGIAEECSFIRYSSKDQQASEASLGRDWKWLYLFIYFETEFHSCYPGWSAMVQSQLTANSATWVQAILLPQLPK